MLNTMQNTIPTTSGIYRIQIGPRTFYWGQAQNLRTRRASHLSALRHGRHANPVLSKAYDKYGPDALEFAVVLLCAPFDLDRYEQALLDAHRGDRACANIAKAAGAPMRGRKHTAETLGRLRARRASDATRRKMSEASRGRKKTAEHAANIAKGMRGRTRSRAHALGLRRAHASAYLVTYTDGTEQLYLSSQEAAALTGHSISNIKRWALGSSTTYTKHNIASIERVDKS